MRLLETLRGITPGNVGKVLVGDEKLGREDARLLVEELRQAMGGAALTVTKGMPEKFVTLPHSLVDVEFLLENGSKVSLFMHYPDTDLYYAPAPGGYHISIAASRGVADLLHRVVADQERRERAAK